MKWPRRDRIILRVKIYQYGTPGSAGTGKECSILLEAINIFKR